MKKIISLAAFLCFCLATSAFAVHVAVLETTADPSAKEMVPVSDRQFLTNVLREEAVKQLPAAQNYTIMTRENIQQMLPPGKAIEDCEGSCLVETGKNIAADYVCQARIGNFGGDLTLSAELYETAGNKLIASFNGQAPDVKELLTLIRQQAPDFFKSVKGNTTGFSGLGTVEPGYLEVKPVLGGDVAKKGRLSITVDGKAVEGPKVQLEPGDHSVRVVHPCYDPAEFNVSIEEGKTQLFNREMKRGKAKLELTAELNGVSQVVPVFLDGVKVGETPFAGKIELCSEVTVKGKGWSEKVMAHPKWHETAKVTHRLKHTPDVVAKPAPRPQPVKPAPVAEPAANDNANVGESVPTNVESKKSTASWVILGIGAAATVAGAALAVVGNNQAKEASEKTYSSVAEYQQYHDDAAAGQKLRSIGVGLAVFGAIGVGVSFVF